MQNTELTIRPLCGTDSLEQLTKLLHRSYKVLADLGLNYVATYQSVKVTRSRISKGTCYVALRNGVNVATIVYTPADKTKGTPWFDRPGVAHIGQLGVEPKLQRQGIGRQLIAHIEEVARRENATELALDTAEPATHLIDWYERLGYRFIERADWDMTNYRSVIMSKTL